MDRKRYLELSVQRLLRDHFGSVPWTEKAAAIAVHEVIDALRYNPAWLPGLGIGGEDD